MSIDLHREMAKHGEWHTRRVLAWLALVLTVTVDAVLRFIVGIDEPFETTLLGLGVVVLSYCLWIAFLDIAAYWLHQAGWQKVGK